MKRTKRTVKTILLITLVALLTGCMNLLTDQLEEEAASESDGTGSLTISVGEGGVRASTVLPSDPVFTKYEIEGDGPDTDSFEPVSSSSSTISVDSLAEGDWTITARGYAEFNGQEVVVAEGEKTLTVNTGESVNESVNISSELREEDPGKFSYDLSVPAGVEADSYEVTLSLFDSDVTEEAFEGGVDTSSDFSVSDSADLPAGYYIATARVTSDREQAVKTTVVHLYDNLESHADFAFSEDDFTPFVELSGTLDVQVDSEPEDVTDWEVVAVYDGEMLETGRATASGDWSMEFPSFETDTDIELYVLTPEGGFPGDPDNPEPDETVTVSAEDTSVALSLDLAAEDLPQGIGGTANIAVDGQELDWANAEGVEVYLFDAEGDGDPYDYTQVQEDGSWFVQVSDESQVPEQLAVAMAVYHVDRGVVVYFAPEAFTASDHLSGAALDLDLALLSMSGTLSVSTTGGDTQPVSSDTINFEGDRNDSEPPLGGFGGDAAVTDGQWQSLVPQQAITEGTSVLFSSSLDGYDVELDESRTLPDPPTGIELVADIGSDSFPPELSGTLEVMVDDVDRTSEGDWSIYAFDHDTGDYLDEYTEVESDGQWSMVVSDTLIGDEVGFRVSGELDTGEYIGEELDTTVTVQEGGNADIALDSSFVSVNGVLDSSGLTIDGNATPEYFWDIRVEVKESDDTFSNYGPEHISDAGEWSVLVPEALAGNTFGVWVDNQYTYWDESAGRTEELFDYNETGVGTIQAGGVDDVSLSPTKDFTTAPWNYALGATANANSYESAARNVVDGNWDWRWSSDRNDPGPSTDDPHWIEVDLEETRTIDLVVVDIAGGDEWAQTFSVEVSDDGDNWHEIGSQTESTGVFGYTVDYSAMEGDVNSIQYIRFESYYSEDDDQVNVYEIAAYE